VLLASFALQFLVLPAHLASHHHAVGHHAHALAHADGHGHAPHSALDHQVTAVQPRTTGASQVAGPVDVASAPGGPTLPEARGLASALLVEARTHRPTGPPHPVGARAPPTC
jgi:hypothetical protein